MLDSSIGDQGLPTILTLRLSARLNVGLVPAPKKAADTTLKSILGVSRAS